MGRTWLTDYLNEWEKRFGKLDRQAKGALARNAKKAETQVGRELAVRTWSLCLRRLKPEHAKCEAVSARWRRTLPYWMDVAIDEDNRKKEQRVRQGERESGAEWLRGVL